MKTLQRRPSSASPTRLCSALLLAGTLGGVTQVAAAPPPTATITEQQILNLGGDASSFWVFDTFDTDGAGVGGDPTLAIAPAPALLAGYGTRAVRMDSGPGTGGTGCAQVRYGYANNREEETEKMRYDLYYIKNRSLWLDLRIMFATIGIVLFGQGAAQVRHPAPMGRDLSWPAAQRLRAKDLVPVLADQAAPRSTTGRQ